MSDVSTVIGNYRIISSIASGSFGRVYLAHHHVLTKRLVALKLMHAVPLISEQERSQFLQEAHILERLEHPYILSILDVGIHEGMPYIVSEYASGNSLRNHLQDQGSQPLPLEEAQTILLQIGQALQYAHDQQVIHRDIKPENILFGAKGNALLADFGLATTLATTSVKYMTNAGTPRYMAPEQFQGQVSRESDQYALGCIAYELFTGRPPFEVSDLVALMYKHVNEAPVPLTHYNPNLPTHVEQAVLKALMKQRSERHSGSLAFIAALQGLSISQLLMLDAASPLVSSGRTETVINKVKNPTLLASGEMAEVESQTFVKGVETSSPILPSNSKKATVSLPVSLHDTENAALLRSSEKRTQPGNSPFAERIFKRRSIWPRMATACMVLVVLSGSLFWFLQAASSHGTKQETSTSASTSSPLHTPTVVATATPSPTKAGKTVMSLATSAPVSLTTPTLVPPTPTPTPTPTPLPPTPTPTILYQADWSGGMDGWVGSSDWSTQGDMLVNNATSNASAAAGPTIVAPYQVEAFGNFAIETRVRELSEERGFDAILFHGNSTASGWQGYKVTITQSTLSITSDDFNDTLGLIPFSPGTTWHTYRVEVRGSRMTMILDGTPRFTISDSRFLSGRQVGMKCGALLNVSSFKITAL